MIDPISIRDRFPALAREQDGRPIVYFDNPAGTQVPDVVIDAMARYLRCDNANTGGEFVTSRATDQLIADTRQALADLLGAASPQEIVFGQNMTSLTFHLSHALEHLLQPGDEVVLTRLEHDANIAPWLTLVDKGVLIRWIDIHPEDGTLDMESAEQAITARTRLLAVGYASNALGTINHVRRLAEMAHAYGAWVFVDAVHLAPHGPIDVQALGCDLLACSTYKFFGPHLGVLYGRYEALATIPSHHVRPAGNEPPGAWETGTQSHEALAGALATVSYLQSLAGPGPATRRAQLVAAMTSVKAYERTLSERLIGGLIRMPEVRVYGITDPAAFDHRVPTVSFTVEGREPAEVAAELGRQGIFSWSGNHYALEPLARLRLSATQRVGLVHYNTAAEIDRFLETLDIIVGRR